VRIGFDCRGYSRRAGKAGVSGSGLAYNQLAFHALFAMIVDGAEYVVLANGYRDKI
jgi:hypothetical protein